MSLKDNSYLSCVMDFCARILRERLDGQKTTLILGRGTALGNFRWLKSLEVVSGFLGTLSISVADFSA